MAKPNTSKAAGERRREKRLNAIGLLRLRHGMHNDGNGLYLNVQKSGSRSWILRTMVRGRRKDIGLGSLSTTTLADAREDTTATRTNGTICPCGATSANQATSTTPRSRPSNKVSPSTTPMATTTAASSSRPKIAISITVIPGAPVSRGGITARIRASSASSAARRPNTNSRSRSATTTCSRVATVS
jgi:hypothetical protein